MVNLLPRIISFALLLRKKFQAQYIQVQLLQFFANAAQLKRFLAK
jgi:hypothetical protein